MFWSILVIFLRLGLTSFGGPVAHLAYFHREFVEQRRWLDDERFADLLAMCQFLPGPASSQLGYSIGLLRGGLPGGLAAWLGFTLPSAIIMIACAAGMQFMTGDSSQRLLHGLLILAAAVVAHAVFGLARRLTPDWQRIIIASLACAAMLYFSSAWLQFLLILVGGLLGWLLLRSPAGFKGIDVPQTQTSGGRGLIPFALFCLLLIGLPLAILLFPHPLLQLTEAFYRSGALVFGGGHVVLPLLQEALVSPGWLDESGFLAGYGAAQALPGPLFSFAAYLGASQTLYPGGALIGLLALLAIFLPGMLLVHALLPSWETLRRIPAMQAALRGSNAVVVGLLLAALLDPVLPKAVHSPWDAGLALLGLLLLLNRRPLWLVISLCLVLSLLLPA